MWAEKFKEVVAGFCTKLSLDPKPVLDGAPFAIGEVMFYFAHQRETDSPVMTVYCDFGAPPKELELQVYRKLLQVNLSAYSGEGETFCLDSEGHIFFVNSYPLDITTAVTLMTHLVLTVEYAKSWKNGYFLDESDVPKKRSWQGERLMKADGLQKK